MGAVEEYRTEVRAFARGLEAARTHAPETSNPYWPSDPCYYEWKRGYALGRAAACARCGSRPELVEREEDWVVCCSRGLHPGDDSHAARTWTEALEAWNLAQATFTADATQGE